MIQVEVREDDKDDDLVALLQTHSCLVSLKQSMVVQVTILLEYEE